MTHHYQRAMMLLERNRVEEAITELRNGLATNPEDAELLSLLAQAYMQKREFAQSLSLIEQALRIEADNPFFHSIRARALLVNNRSAAALEAIHEALRMEPVNDHFYHIKGMIHHHREEWREALEAAELGLSHNAENVDLLNARSEALIKLNRRIEAVETADFSLKNAPENADSHVNRAFAALNIGDYDTAFNHYREALRLEPNNDYARYGLKEAIKAKNPAYRIVLNYFLWMSRMQEQYRWGFVIGIYVLYRIILSIARNNPEWSGYLAPILVAYILFAFSTWIAEPVSNFFLRFHPLGKHAMDDDETLASNITAALFVAGVISITVFYVTGGKFDFSNFKIMEGNATLFLLGLVFIFMLIPVGGMFSTREHTPARRNLRNFTIALGVVGALGTTLFGGLLIVFFLGIFFYGWVANYVISKSNREF